MKKILLFLIAAAVLDGMLTAQPAQSESGLKPSVTADASVTWGMDLGNSNVAKHPEDIRHGFENKITMKVLLPLYQGILSSKTEGDVYTEFNIGVDLAYRYKGELSNSYSSDATFGYKPWKNTLSKMSATLHFFA